MPLAYTYDLKDVLDRCYRWNARHFVRLWPTKHFAILPPEILSECCKAVVAEMVNPCEFVFEQIEGTNLVHKMDWCTEISTLFFADL